MQKYSFHSFRYYSHLQVHKINLANHVTPSGFCNTNYKKYYNNISLSGFKSRRDDIIVEMQKYDTANPEGVTLKYGAHI